jgi:hypothetical protein
MSSKRKWTKTGHWSFDEKKASKPTKVKRLRNDQKQPELDAHTFDDWSGAGYRISKGAKSRSRNLDGVPLFGLDQVWTNDKKARPPVSKKPSIFVPVPTSCPPVKPSTSSWSQPSGLVKEVLARMEEKKETEEEKHMHMPESFETNEDDYKDLPY